MPSPSKSTQHLARAPRAKGYDPWAGFEPLPMPAELTPTVPKLTYGVVLHRKGSPHAHVLMGMSPLSPDIRLSRHGYVQSSPSPEALAWVSELALELGLQLCSYWVSTRNPELEAWAVYA